MSGTAKTPLAPVGSTGNNNHVGVGVSPGSRKLAVELVVEAVGATPTVTYKLQGTMVEGTPAASDWEDIFLVPASSDTPAGTRVVTAVGRYLSYVSLAHSKFFAQVRLVTSANTNVTYSANLHQQYAN